MLMINVMCYSDSSDVVPLLLFLQFSVGIRIYCML